MTIDPARAQGAQHNLLLTALLALSVSCAPASARCIAEKSHDECFGRKRTRLQADVDFIRRRIPQFKRFECAGRVAEVTWQSASQNERVYLVEACGERTTFHCGQICGRAYEGCTEDLERGEVDCALY